MPRINTLATVSIVGRLRLIHSLGSTAMNLLAWSIVWTLMILLGVESVERPVGHMQRHSRWVCYDGMK